MPDNGMIFSGGPDGGGGKTTQPISKTVGNVVIAVPLILELLKLQKIVISTADITAINDGLQKLHSLDGIMITRLKATPDNINSLTQGSDLIASIIGKLQTYIAMMPDQGDQLTPKGIIEAAMEKDIVGAQEQFKKKIRDLEAESSPATTHRYKN